MLNKLATVVAVAALASTSVAGGDEGQAWVDVSLNDEGKVIAANVARGAPEELAGAIREWIKTQEFQPATLGGRPVSSTTFVRVQYMTEPGELGGGVQFLGFTEAPMPILILEAQYPQDDLLSGREGSATICFTVDSSGAVKAPKVFEATNPAFAESARRSVSRWLFKTRTVDGQPAPMEGCQTIDFTVAAGQPARDPSQTPPIDADVTGRAWLDVSLDEQGQLIEATVVDDVPSGLIEPIKTCLRKVAFEPAVADGMAARSTVSIWVEYMLHPTTSGYELYCTDFGDGPRPVKIVEARHPKGERPFGEAQVSFTIDETGRVVNPKVIEATNPAFATAALRAVRQWRFQPRTINGQPTPMEMTQTIRFLPDSAVLRDK